MAILKRLLSESLDGKGIKITATASPGTLIHEARSLALDEIWLYAYNSSVVSITFTLEWGGSTVDDRREYILLPKREILLIPGLVLTGSLEVRCYAQRANELFIYGFVHELD